MNLKGILYNTAVIPTRLVRNLIDPPAVILLYHRVAELPADPQQLAVAPARFAAHLDHLRTHYHVCSVEEFVSYKSAGKPFPAKSVLLTFDDGYADNCINALPILEAAGLQALFFIATSMVGSSGESWWDDLERIVYQARLPLQLTLELPAGNRRIDVPSESGRESAYGVLHHVIKYLDPEERIRALHSLRVGSGIPEEGRLTHRFLSRSQIETMVGSPAAVLGAHTHHHIPLNILSREQQREEILQSKEFLEAITKKPVRHFSYPYGLKKDYNTDSIRLCRELGFETACANYHGQVHRWTSRYRLPRIIVRDWPGEVFEHRLRRFFLY